MPIKRLRLVLTINAAFSAIGGLVAIVTAGWVSRELGLDHVVITRLIGAGLIVFAAGAYSASRASEDRLLREAALISTGDFSWVAATLVVLATGILTTAGVVIALAISVMVLDFGSMQLRFRSKALAAQSTATVAV